MIDLYLLEQLNAFDRLGTLSRAAESLYITQPALTRSMKKIEEEMGITLFHRDKRKLTFNKAGRVVAEYAKRILETEREMMIAACEADQQERVFSLGSCGVIPAMRVSALASRLFPGKEVTWSIEDDNALTQKLRLHRHQTVILHDRPKESSLYVQPYIREQAYVSVPEKHPLAKKASVKRTDLVGMDILAYEGGILLHNCRSSMPDTTFIVLKLDRKPMTTLAFASELILFGSNLAVEDGFLPPGKKNIPIDEPFAQTQYYLACLDAEKDRYQRLFRAIAESKR